MDYVSPSPTIRKHSERATEIRRLPLPARRLAYRFGLDASTAALIATLAGFEAAA